MGEEDITTTIDSYDKTVGDYIKNADGLHPVKEAKRFLSYLDKHALILDLGCGPGRDAIIFTQKGFRVVGIDLSKKMIERAKTRFKSAEFKVMDVRKLKFSDGHFDGVWASAIFLHVPKKDVPATLKEAHRVLKKNGVFYVSAKEGSGEILKPDKRYPGDIKKFWSFFQEEELVNELKKAGFGVLDSYTEKQDNPYAKTRFINILCRK